MTRTPVLLTLLVLTLAGVPAGRGPDRDAPAARPAPAADVRRPAPVAARAAPSVDVLHHVAAGPVVEVLEARACKPGAPVEVGFEVVPTPDADGRLDLRLQLRPVLALDALAWRLELPPGVVADGPTSGAADPRAGEATVVDLPVTRRGDPAGELALVVEGRLPGGAPIVVRRSARLGAAPAARPDAVLVDRETGARSRVAPLPVLHRSGR